GAPGVVKAVKTADARTVQILLNLPYAPLLTVLAHPAMSIVRLTKGPDGAPRWLGTGAFLVAETAPGRMVLEANPAYWGGTPRSSRMVLIEHGDDARAAAELDARALDLYVPAGAPARMTGALA